MDGCMNGQMHTEAGGNIQVPDWTATLVEALFPCVRLADADRGQVPAMLYRINDDRVLYCSASDHCGSVNGRPLEISRMYSVCTYEGAPSITELTIIEVDACDADKIYDVKTSHSGTYHLVRPCWDGDGRRGDDVLRRLDLADYDITHDSVTGDLVSLVPKG